MRIRTTEIWLAHCELVEKSFKTNKQDMEKQIFKVGDRVYDVRYGWGKVVGSINREKYSVIVDYGDGFRNAYTFCGRDTTDDVHPMLSLTEYTLEGFSQERKHGFKDGDLVWVRNEGDVWQVRYFCSGSEKINATYKYQQKSSQAIDVWDECLPFDENPLLKDEKN